MLIITNSEGNAEKRFTFNGYPDFDGDQITKDEFRQFAIETLFNEYKIRDVDVRNLNLQISSKDVNFSFNSSHAQIGFIIRLKDDDANEDFSEIISKCEQNNISFRLAITHFITFETRGDWKLVEIGQNGYRNDVYPIYMVRFEVISLNPDNYPISDELLEHNKLIQIFAEAWSNLETKKLIKYLDVNFHYYSDWVFDILPSRDEYVKYLNGKFNTLKEHNLNAEFEIVKNERNELALLFNQNGEKSLFYIKTNNGKIMMAHMSKLPIATILKNMNAEVSKHEGSWLKRMFKRNKST